MKIPPIYDFFLWVIGMINLGAYFWSEHHTLNLFIAVGCISLALKEK